MNGGSEDLAVRNRTEAASRFSTLACCYLRRQLFRELLWAYGETAGLHGYAALEAHGGYTKDGRWVFGTEESTTDTQSLIDRLDGRVLAIMLFVCNGRNKEVTSRKSAVIHLSCRANFLDVYHGRKGYLRLYLPGYGYVEHSARTLRRIADDHLERVPRRRVDAFAHQAVAAYRSFLMQSHWHRN